MNLSLKNWRTFLVLAVIAVVLGTYVSMLVSLSGSSLYDVPPAPVETPCDRAGALAAEQSTNPQRTTAHDLQEAESECMKFLDSAGR